MMCNAKERDGEYKWEEVNIVSNEKIPASPQGKSAQLCQKKRRNRRRSVFTEREQSKEANLLLIMQFIATKRLTFGYLENRPCADQGHGHNRFTNQINAK